MPHATFEIWDLFNGTKPPNVPPLGFPTRSALSFHNFHTIKSQGTQSWFVRMFFFLEVGLGGVVLFCVLAGGNTPPKFDIAPEKWWLED